MSNVSNATDVQLALSFAPDAAGVTRVVRRRVRYPYTFLRPFWFGDRPDGIATVILQSASGGLFGGERLTQLVTLERGAAAHITTQAAAVVHAARKQPATEQVICLRLASQAYLEYLPDVLILFPGARLSQRLIVELDPGATVLVSDGFVRHDPGSGDLPFLAYRNDVEVYLSGGRLLLADRAEVAGRDFDRVLKCRGAAWRACGSLLVVAPSAVDRHAALVAKLNEGLAPLTEGADATVYAASAELPNQAGVICRMVARGGAELRAAIETCWRSTRMVVTGAAAPRRRK